MALRHPRDIAAWRQWQQSTGFVRQVRSAVRSTSAVDPPVLLTRNDGPVDVVIGLDGATPTKIAALVTPIERGGLRAAIVADRAGVTRLADAGWRPRGIARAAAADLTARVAVVAGQHLPVGTALSEWAGIHGRHLVVVQHGLLTPYAPPLPPNTHLLAWSEADGDFYASGRSDVQCTAVGSQLFWDAAQHQSGPPETGRPPLFLGQLHGAELPRRGLARAASRFCRTTGARYRPHPAEVDKLSRLYHALWERRGIEIDRSQIPLVDLSDPVVSVFSTGVIEAAARGVPSWVYYPGPPGWLEEFWDRYGMSRWGDEPTPAPHLPAREPARAIADAITAAID